MLERFERFTLAVNEVQRAWTKIASEEMNAYGLKGSYLVYLIVMQRRPEGITAAQLGSLCSRDKGDVSRAVTVMESKGLIKKESGSGNLYRAKLLLTDEGRLMTESIVKKAEIAENIAGEGLSEGEREAMYSALEKITENLKELSKTGIPNEEPAAEPESGAFPAETAPTLA